MKINSLRFLLYGVLLFAAACTKITSTEIGTDLVPAVDGVITKDTIITVNAKNAGDTTIRPVITENHVVGNVQDPLFGNTEAKINFQLSLPSSNFHFETDKANLFLDSVVMVLSYTGMWGDSTRPVYLGVGELDRQQTFMQDTLFDAYGYKAMYNNTQNFAVSNLLTASPIPVDPRRIGDSVYVFKDSGINMIRLRLMDDFGRRLLFDYDTTNAYKNDSAFRSNVKGLQVYANGVNNSLLKVALTGSNTKLALYYRYHPADSAAGILEPAVKYFAVGNSSAHSNYIARDRSTGVIGTYLPTDPGTPNDEYVFIQGPPGTYATLNLDTAALALFPNVIVHRAELLMEKVPDTDPLDAYFTPPFLFLLAKDDTSNFVIPGFDPSTAATADALFSSSFVYNYADFGGIPRKNAAGNTYYSFNISRYIQGVITKHNPQHPLFLYAPFNEPFKLLPNLPYTTARGYVTSTPVNTAGAGRVRLYGGGNDISNSQRMRLRIVYSVPHE